MHRGPIANNIADLAVSGDKTAYVTSPSKSPSKLISSIASLKLEPKINNATSDPVMAKRPSPPSPKQSDRPENATISRPDAQKLATSRPAEKPSIPLPMPLVSRPLSAPIAVGPRPAVSVVSMVQTAPTLARSVSAVGRLGPEPTTTPYASQSYVPQSYRNAIVGPGPIAGSSSAYSQNHSSSSVSNASYSYSQTFSPHISDRTDPNPIGPPSISFGMVNQHQNHHHDMLQNGPLWIERPQRNGSRSSMASDVQSFDLYTPTLQSRSEDHLPSEFPAGTSGRHVLPDEFPHLDIINDLLDDEIGTGANLSYRMFNDGPSHNLNRQYSYPGDPGLSSGLGPSGRFDRARSSHDDGFHGYSGSGRSYDGISRDNMIPQAGQRQYVNGQIDGFVPNQWQTAGSDMPFLSVRNVDNDGYPYHTLEYPNINMGGINGYTIFRPSNGH